MGEHTALSNTEWYAGSNAGSNPAGSNGFTAGGSRGTPVRVLIVEDHEVLSSSLAVVLDSEPDLQTVGRAATLADARRAVVATAPDVVLLDHQLPDGDGVASIEELRALREGLAFVVLTASTSDAVISKRLFVSVHTVRNHVANLANKLGAHSRLEVLSIAMRKGLLPDK